jgi:hypothetical protein
MKPENYGIYGVINALLHGAEFIIEILGRIGPIKIIFCIKPNDHLIYHKEQIPANIKKAYQSMLKTCKIDRKSKEYSNHSNSIAAMYNHAQILKNRIPQKYTEISNLLSFRKPVPLSYQVNW